MVKKTFPEGNPYRTGFASGKGVNFILIFVNIAVNFLSRLHQDHLAEDVFHDPHIF